MKTTLTLLFTMLFLAGFSQVEWAPVGAEWYYSRHEGLMPPDEGYILYKVVKDTTIQEKSVRLISKTYYHANGQDVSNLGNEYTYEKDSVVYYWKNGHFYTLYDFTAKPGDKWTIYGNDNIGDFCGYDSLGVVVVDSVSTMTINNQELKVLYTSPDSSSNWGFEDVILERIGCLYYLLPMARDCAVDVPNENGRLRCYEDDNLGFYKTPYWEQSNYECDVLWYYSLADDKKFNRIQIYPNPVKNYLNIRFSDTHYGNSFIQTDIFDINGKKLNTYRSPGKIFVSHLSRGVYYARIFESNQVYYFKFLKE